MTPWSTLTGWQVARRPRHRSFGPALLAPLNIGDRPSTILIISAKKLIPARGGCREAIAALPGGQRSGNGPSLAVPVNEVRRLGGATGCFEREGQLNIPRRAAPAGSSKEGPQQHRALKLGAREAAAPEAFNAPQARRRPPFNLVL